MIRRRLQLPSLALLLALQSCAVWSPGKDPAGRVHIATANQVLFALQACHAAEGHLPVELSELVPKYIPLLPRSPSSGSTGKAAK
jgi:hypothetical protein